MVHCHRMQQYVLVVAGAIVIGLLSGHVMGRSVEEAEIDGSCMVKWIQALPSAPSAAQARRLGRVLALVSMATPVDETTVNSLDQHLLPDVLGSDLLAQEFKSCLGRGTDHCRLNAPCRNGGHCQYSRSVVGYHCQCTEGFSGEFCKTGLAPCASSPCQNGGTCRADGSLYTCQCPPLVSGTHCHNMWIDEDKFSQQQQAIIGIIKKLDKLETKVDKLGTKVDSSNPLGPGTVTQFLRQLSEKLTARLDAHLAALPSGNQVHVSHQEPKGTQLPAASTTPPASALAGVCRRGTVGVASGTVTARHQAGLYTARCDRETDGGGWTVIQRRRDGSVNFRRKWAAYKTGFGDASGEYWLGLENIHQLTSQSRQRMELRIDMTFATSGTKHFAHYSTFLVGPESDKYRLLVTGFSSPDLTDAFESWNNGMQFSAIDRDNDLWPRSCTNIYHAGWWYKGCQASNLNGLYGRPDGQGSGCQWPYNLDGVNAWVALKSVEMKIRPVQ